MIPEYIYKYTYLQSKSIVVSWAEEDFYIVTVIMVIMVVAMVMHAWCYVTEDVVSIVCKVGVGLFFCPAEQESQESKSAVTARPARMRGPLPCWGWKVSTHHSFWVVLALRPVIWVLWESLLTYLKTNCYSTMDRDRQRLVLSLALSWERWRETDDCRRN